MSDRDTRTQVYLTRAEMMHISLLLGKSPEASAHPNVNNRLLDLFTKKLMMPRG